MYSEILRTMSFKRALCRVFPVIPATNLKVGRRLHALWLRHNKAYVRKQLKDKKNVLANVGCGKCGIESGWVNVDFNAYANLTFAYDCRLDLPFADQSVAGIYTEHFFEHLDFVSEAPYFLRDCHRVLEPQGVLRIVVLDAEKYLGAYCEPDWEAMSTVVPLVDGHTDAVMGIEYKTKLEVVNEVFRQSGEHKYAWDFETLAYQLRKAGFGVVDRMFFRRSHLKALEIDLAVLEPNSLYVDAAKD